MKPIASCAGNRTLAAAVLIATIFAAPGTALETEAAPPAGDPIEPGIWRVAGIEPGGSTSDLEPLRTLLGKASVVGLGESIHTSGGYYTAKHRLFRFLVERAGFRALAIESPWEAADRVGTYVRTCGGSAEEALEGLIPEWQGAEVRDLVAWMCAWNRGHRSAKDRLSFVGFDIQQPEADGAALAAFLGRGVPGADGELLVAGTQRCDGVGGPRATPGTIPAADHTACLEALDAIAETFTRQAKEIIRRTSKTDFEWAKVRLLGLRSWQEFGFYIRSDSVRSDEARDSGMAAVLRAMMALRLPKKTKVATWGHNFHVSRAPLLDPNGVARTMGTFLGESLGAGYFAVGLIGWNVSVDMGALCGATRLPSPQSVEGRLHATGEAYALVDPRVSSSALEAGETVQVSGFDVVPADHFGALLFLDQSPKMVPIFRPPCGS